MRRGLGLVPLLLLLVLAACSEREARPPVPSPTPPPAATGTPPPATPAGPTPTPTPASSACDGQGTLVNGLLIVPLTAPEPSCTRAATATDPDQGFALRLPAGLYREEQREAGASSRVIYWAPDPATGRDVASVTLTRRRVFEEPPILRADAAEPFAALPRPGVLVRRADGYMLAWRGPGGVFELDVLTQAFRVDPARVAALLIDIEQAALRPSPEPWWVYPVTAGTGVRVVDEAIAAIQAGRIASFIRPGRAPCDPGASGIAPPPSCPPGVQPGALVPALVQGGCGTAWRPLSPDRVDLVESFARDRGEIDGLYAVVRSDDGDGVAHLLVYSMAQRFSVVALNGDGVMGAAVCDPVTIQDWLRRTRLYLLPPLFP